MKEKKWFRIALLLLMLICGGIIISYFWESTQLQSIQYVPMYVMVLALIYILTQIIKRTIYKEQNWYDWLYYVGLISIMLPTFFAKDENEHIFHLITDYGTFFLIIPLFIEGKNIIHEK